LAGFETIPYSGVPYDASKAWTPADNNATNRGSSCFFEAVDMQVAGFRETYMLMFIGKDQRYKKQEEKMIERQALCFTDCVVSPTCSHRRLDLCAVLLVDAIDEQKLDCGGAPVQVSSQLAEERKAP
jgi:hypothetical protein